MCDLCCCQDTHTEGDSECLRKTAERLAALQRDSAVLVRANRSLRIRIHQLEKHTTSFELCDSSWCQPGDDWNPATDIPIAQSFRSLPSLNPVRLRRDSGIRIHEKACKCAVAALPTRLAEERHRTTFRPNCSAGPTEKRTVFLPSLKMSEKRCSRTKSACIRMAKCFERLRSAPPPTP